MKAHVINTILAHVEEVTARKQAGKKGADRNVRSAGLKVIMPALSGARSDAMMLAIRDLDVPGFARMWRATGEAIKEKLIAQREKQGGKKAEKKTEKKVEKKAPAKAPANKVPAKAPAKAPAKKTAPTSFKLRG